MFKQSATLLFLFSCCLVGFISCEKESSDDETLKDYRLTVETTKSIKTENIFFVGKVGRETGLYKYNLNDNEYELFWSARKQIVVQLSYSDNLEYAFFITAKKIGVRRGVSFIRGIKLYRLDLRNSSVELIRKIGDAVQLLADWIDTNYNIQFTRFDMKISSRIKKVNQIYSPFGKLIKEETEIFDFIKDGYPQFEISRTSLISPSGNFGITQSEDSVFLSIAGVDGKVFVDSTGGKITEVKWNSEENFVFFTTRNTEENKKRNNSTEIYIYDVVHKKLTKKLISNYKINFIIVNDLLIFDTSLNNQSSIAVYDYKKDEDVSSIQVRGGCGLIYLPNN